MQYSPERRCGAYAVHTTSMYIVVGDARAKGLVTYLCVNAFRDDLRATVDRSRHLAPGDPLSIGSYSLSRRAVYSRTGHVF